MKDTAVSFSILGGDLAGFDPPVAFTNSTGHAETDVIWITVSTGDEALIGAAAGKLPNYVIRITADDPAN